MLAFLFLRIIWPLLFSTLALAILFPLLHPFTPLLAYLLTSSLLLLLARTTIAAIRTETSLAARGGHAPWIRDYSPFGVGVLWRVFRKLSRHCMDEFWSESFGAFGRARNPYTVATMTAGTMVVLTADEENVKAVLATQYAEYGKGEEFRRDWREFLGLSIFTTDGEIWHSSRNLLRPQFIKDRVSDLHKFETHTQHLFPLLGGSGETIRIDDLFYRFALDAATDFLFGSSVDSLRKGQTEFAAAFAEVQRVQGLIARTAPLHGLVPRGSFRRGLKVLNEFVNRYIDAALRLSQEELEKVTKSDEGYTFLHALASYTRDREVLRDQIVAVLLAGRDTTAVTLSWLFYELSKRPAVVERLREEIRSVVGLHRQPTYSDLKSMRYLQHNLNETLRLYPVVPYNIRVALQDSSLPHGGGADGNEPIDTPVGYSTFILHRRPDIYPDPSTGFPHHLDFVPERWESWTPKPWTYIPFNGGPRICIGQQFALTEMSYVVCRIFQTFSRVECKQTEFPGFRTDIVLQPAHGVKVAFHRGE